MRVGHHYPDSMVMTGRCWVNVRLSNNFEDEIFMRGSKLQPYQAMTQKRGFFGTLIPAPNPNLPIAFGYRQGIPNPYSLRSQPSKVNLSFCKFCRHYQIKPPIMYSNILLLGIRGCFPHL